MRRFLLVISLTLLTAVSGLCQNSTVTATVTDNSAQVWMRGTWNITLNNPHGGQPVYANNGQRVTTGFQGSMDNTGTFTISGVAKNGAIAPAGTTWKFTICPAANSTNAFPTCYSMQTTISQDTTNLTTQLSAIAIQPTSLAASPLATAYSTGSLAVPLSVGYTFFNSTTETIETWDGAKWVSAGGGGTPLPPCSDVNAIQNSTGSSFNCDPNIQLDIANHKVTLGPQPNHANPAGTNSAYGNYQGLAQDLNVQTDCPAITGLVVHGDGSTDDLQAIQQCIWQRMGICPTLGTVCAPTDNRFATTNSTGVNFLFPQRSFTASYGVGCSYFFSGPLDIPWGANLRGVGAGLGESATKLCWNGQTNGVFLRGFGVMEHLDIWNTPPGWSGSNIATFVLPTGFGGAANGDGIIMGSGSLIRDVHVRYWPRHGISCDSTRTDWPVPETTNQCDTSTVDHVYLYNNGGMGLYVHGSDGGVNHFSRISAYQNQLYGFWVASLYTNQFDILLSDGNHSDATPSTGIVPAITSTSCTTTLCTFTTGTAHGLASPGGDLLTLSGCSDISLNGAQTVNTTPTTTTFTVLYSSPFGAETPTGCSATYRLGTHVWATAGNTVQGRNGAGGCIYGANGLFLAPYCEGDQPSGTFFATAPDLPSSVVIQATGATPNIPIRAGIIATNNTLGTYGLLDAPWQSPSAVRLDTSDTQGAISLDLWNTNPNGFALQQTSIFSRLVFRRTFYGSGLNGTLTNWWCFMASGTYNNVLGSGSGCAPDISMLGGVTSCTVTNGGTGYTAPVATARSANGTGQGTVFSLHQTGGVIDSCTVTTPGAGWVAVPLITVFDATGTGATLTAGIGAVPGTITGRTGMDGRGIWWMPNSMCLGSLGSYIPTSCWMMGTAAPTTGTWRVGDLVINQSGVGPFAWKNTTAGTPGVWTPIPIPTSAQLAVTQYAHLATTPACNLATPSSYDTCTNTITWPVAFSDTNYGYTCNGIDAVGSGGSVALTLSTTATGKTTTQAVAVTQTMSTGTGQHFTDIQCIGVHN
jgi:hypothetical protein